MRVFMETPTKYNIKKESAKVGGELGQMTDKPSEEKKTVEK